MFPVAFNEAHRLQKVFESGILDSGFEAQFDALVGHASEIFGVPISLITILDRERQWFKAVRGFELRETRREDAFCNHAVATGRRLVVEDASVDERFSSNPFVLEDGGIRFYAGVPLSLNPGVHVGTLCILDRKPRRLSPTAIRTLERLGHIAEALLRQFLQANELRELSAEIGNKNIQMARQNAELLVKQKLLEDAFRLAGMGAWEKNLSTGIYRWSETLFALHGVPNGSQITEDTIRGFYSDKEWERLSETVEKAYSSNAPYEIELEFLTARGERRHARVCSAVEFGDDGVPIRRFGLKQDITAEKQVREALRRLAETDTLTGLANRTTLMAQMENFRTSETAMCVMVLDLDGFKDINDTSGHEAGDACLREVAQRLRSLPTTACVARVGGDEFAIVFGATDQVHMDAIADWVLQRMVEPFVWKHLGFQVTASIGITHSLGRPVEDPTVLLTEADLALYDAKAKGRNLRQFFTEGLRVEAAQKVDTIGRVHRALRKKEFSLHYQPKVRMTDRKIVGFEALIRWNNAGVIRGPGEFRAALDDTVLSRQIGAFVIDDALRQAGKWVKAGADFGHIAVNMSPQQFLIDDPVEHLLDGMKRHGLSSHHIQLEITEQTVLSRSADEVRAVCARLREEGILIAFDDFGTGFASLTHLIEFPVDVIKVDRGFIEHIVEDARTRAIVTSILGLARNLDLKVVAEGVETEEQRELLLSMGCTVAQGYLFSPAVPAHRLFQQAVSRQTIQR